MPPRRRQAEEVVTAEKLLGKSLRVRKLQLPVTDDNGEASNLDIKIKALSSDAYDSLLALHPPTDKQKKEGDNFNTDTFAPALIQAVVIAPALTLEQADALWHSDTWSTGELRDLFMNCVSICQAGLDVSFGFAG